MEVGAATADAGVSAGAGVRLRCDSDRGRHGQQHAFAERLGKAEASEEKARQHAVDAGHRYREARDTINRMVSRLEGRGKMDGATRSELKRMLQEEARWGSTSAFWNKRKPRTRTSAWTWPGPICGQA